MTDQEQPSIPDRGAAVPPRRRKVWFGLRSLMRTRIVAGLLTVIPIWVTWVVLKFVFDTMRSATEPIAWWFAQRLQEGAEPVIVPDEQMMATQAQIVRDAVIRLVENSPQTGLDPTAKALVIDEIVRKLNYTLSRVPEASAGVLSESTLNWLVPFLAVLLTLFFLYALGLSTASVFGGRVLRLIESVFGRLPLVKTIYRSTKQVVMSFGGASPWSFNKVVLVQFPGPGMKRVAFLTSVMTDPDTERKIASIFIPYTPYLTTGYMQLVPLDEVSETNWSVEDVVKWVMSGGILSPGEVAFDKVHPVRMDELESKVKR